MKSKKVLLSISGGVDSLSLLNMLIHPDSLKSNKALAPVKSFIDNKNLAPNSIDLLYIDHQQRPGKEIQKDLSVIKTLVDSTDLLLRVVKIDLPKNCSEDQARQLRYKALNKIKKEGGHQAIITAHHADDQIETALINLIRGTGPRGLGSLTHQDLGVWRPFLYKTQLGHHVLKSDIIKYANLNELTWSEDTTNQSSDYLRNRVRSKIANTPDSLRLKKDLLHLIKNSINLNKELELELNNLKKGLLLADKAYPIPQILSLPPELQRTLMHSIISAHSREVDKKTVLKSLDFINEKTTGKVLQMRGSNLKILPGKLFKISMLEPKQK